MTAAVLIVAAGWLAALPFRRPSADTTAAPSPGIATGPTSAAIDAVSTSQRGDWSAGFKFDPTLAWQPVPMSLPQRHSPELPLMPDAYSDVAFELEQPDPIRQRFSAALNNREPVLETGPSIMGHAQTHRSEPSESQTPQPQRPDSLPRRLRGLAAEDLIKDRFVYTPIEPPKPPSLTEDPSNQRGTHAQSASMIRSGRPPQDDASRQRHFIREPQ